ncbi:serine protease 3-like [Drosophila innubila]|uniref:serine protease 3-like n=1 Tax=Drosophila innubila TaxID=198719 RepID=UPI00148E2520|nr:serine protease 3-like [Drosophila innubila]
MPSIEGRIGDTNAAPGQFPFVVELVFTSILGITSWSCMGSIISPKTVVTNGLCTLGATQVKMYYGSTQRGVGELVQTVNSNNFKRPLLPLPLGMSMAAIMTPAVQFSSYSYIDEIKFPEGEDEPPYEGEVAIAVKMIGNILKYSSNTIVSANACLTGYNILSPVCTTPSGSCISTPGSPLTLNNQLIGVGASLNFQNCVGLQDIFVTSVRFRGWIVNVSS